MKKTILISIFQSFLARSILGTEAFRKLISNKDIKIVILAPDFKKSFYEENFGTENVTVEAVDDAKLRALSTTKFHKLSVLLLPTYFVRYRMKEKLYEKKRYLNFISRAFINYILAPFKISHRIFRFLDSHVSSTELFDHYFDKYKPDSVFATDIFSPTDANFLLSANRHKVKTIGMVRSWDCTTNKNFLRIVPSHVATNNTFVAEELVKFHDVDSKTIVPVGFAQFDSYINTKPDSREDFFKEIGADINKRLILFAPGGSALTNVDGDYCDILDKALKEGKIPNNLQFLVSTHPQDTTDLSQFKDNKNFIIRRLGVSFGNNAKATEVNEAATRGLINYIVHSDLLISLNTSMGLDVVIFDKPHIMIGFDGYEQRPFLKSVRRYHRENNMWGFIQTGAVRVAYSPEEMLEWINKYLADPSIDAMGRERARKEILYKVDGKSGDRIADFILKFL